jgi:UDP-glucose 4-epimerase
VATCCKNLGVKLVHASTGSVYGEAIGIQDESHALNPTSYYGISKLAGEKYAKHICDATILRYFHVYGSRQESKDDRGGVLAIWVRRLMDNKPIILYGDGTQERSFTYVKDVVRANILAMEKGNGIYNVASGYNYTLNDMINTLTGIFPEVEIAQKDWQVGDVKKFNVDNSKINELGMSNWVELNEGIRLTV